MLGVSVDSFDDHRKWKKDIAAYGKHTSSFSIIGDVDLVVSEAFDMLLGDAYSPEREKPNLANLKTDCHIVKQVKLN